MARGGMITVRNCSAAAKEKTNHVFFVGFLVLFFFSFSFLQGGILAGGVGGGFVAGGWDLLRGFLGRGGWGVGGLGGGVGEIGELGELGWVGGQPAPALGFAVFFSPLASAPAGRPQRTAAAATTEPAQLLPLCLNHRSGDTKKPMGCSHQGEHQGLQQGSQLAVTQ